MAQHETVHDSLPPPIMTRSTVSTGSHWEKTVGYSRLVRVGPFIHVAGTTAVDSEGTVVAPGNPSAQTTYVLRKIEKSLLKAGASIDDVVRTRIYVTDISDWEVIGRAHGDVFREVRPASTMVQVAALIDPQMVVEIEVDAIVQDDATRSDETPAGVRPD